MGILLRILAVVYLVLIWAGVIIMAIQPGIVITPTPFPYAYSPWHVLLAGVLLSVPGLVLYAFGQITDDVRAIRNQSMPE
jgi:hypothetical protein